MVPFRGIGCTPDGTASSRAVVSWDSVTVAAAIPIMARRLTRHQMQLVAPSALEDDPLIAEAVVDLIHHVLPSLGRRYLRKFMQHAGVRTLVMILPEDLAHPATGGKDDTSDSSDSEDAADASDEAKGSEVNAQSDDMGQSKSEAAIAAEADEGENVEDEEDEDQDGRDDSDDESDDEGTDDDGPGMPTGLDPAARALMKRRLAGAVCYELGERLGERLVQVSLLGVRLRYQRLGVASRLVRALLSGEASDERPEAAIAWADTRAIPFFRRHGFAEDALLNARYREISAPWARATLMSAQLPPPVPEAAGSTGAKTAVSGWATASNLDDTLEAWRKARLLEYSKELCLIEKLHAEIRMLREKVSVQQGHAAVIMAENQKLRMENATLTREFEAYRRARSGAAAHAAEAAAAAHVAVVTDVTDEARESGEGWKARSGVHEVRSPMLASAKSLSAADWIAEAEAEAAREVAASMAESRNGGSDPAARPLTSDARSRSSSQSSSHTTSVPASPASPSGRARQRWNAALAEGVSREELQEALRRCKPGAAGPSRSLALTKWIMPSAESAKRLQHRHASCRALLTDPDLTLRLFYGAPQADLQRLLENGFDGVPPDPHRLSEYGRGWYFSKYATHAHHYTAGGGCVLLAEVAVGSTETVVRRDAGRGAPSAGFDSMVVPGRRLPSASGLRGVATGDVNEEYVIFDGSQAVPLCLVFYEDEGGL